MIDVRDLTFTYARGNREAVLGLTFAVERGEIFGFLGPSGAGKSTTQKILTGLLDGYQGAVRVRDKEVAAWTADDYERIGVTFETPNHFLKLTGLENLRFLARLYQGATRAPASLLASVGRERDGDRRVGEYSKGMTCRLAGLTDTTLLQVVASAATAAPLAPTYALFLGTFAANKVQGFALAKAVGVVMVPCISAYFVTDPWQHAFGLVPHYWALKVFWLFDEGAVGPALAHALIGLAWQGVLIAVLVRRFSHTVRQ